MASQSSQAAVEPIGIFTKTIVKNPVVQHLLQARIRHADFQDVIFVGEDYIKVKEIRDNGHLRHVATKDDFYSRIRAAKTLTVDPDAINSEPPFIKREHAIETDFKTLPPQILALTLDNGKLVFLSLRLDTQGRWEFTCVDVALPRHEHLVLQAGEHLAVDSQSRAIAVAAAEGEIIIWPLKSKDAIKVQLELGDHKGSILDAPRYLKVEGVITQMDFLSAPRNDPDHIILLVIVIVAERVKAIWIDWEAGTDIYLAQVHPPQVLEKAISVPNLLIPIRNAAFILVCGHEIKRWRNLLSGSVTGAIILVQEQESAHPGLSPRRPLWASWCRPRRSPAAARERDVFYLAREDGVVYYLEMSSENRAQACIAGTLDCHVGNAFVSLGDDWLPDVLAMAGDMSTGRVVSIGQWPSAEDFERPWDEAMAMQLVESIPNWASVTDMTTTTLPHSHSQSARSREAVFVTSGREPYGTVTELREGVEAQQVFYIEDDSFENATEAWALQSPTNRSTLVVLTYPTSTMFLEVSPDGQEVSSVDDALLPGLETRHRSLALQTLQAGDIVQVSERSVCMSDPVRGTGSAWNCEDGTAILCAAMNADRRIVVVGQQSGDEHSLRSFRVSLPADPVNVNLESISPFAQAKLPAESLCLLMFEYGVDIYTLVVTANGMLQLFSVSEENIENMQTVVLPAAADAHPASNHMVILQGPNPDTSLLVCGMRDGRALCFVLRGNKQSMTISDTFETRFGQAAVTVTPLDTHSACLMTGLDTCSITWDGTHSLQISSIWITDKFRPEFSQGPVIACKASPSTNSLDTGRPSMSCMFLSGPEIMFTELATQPHVVPRQIPVKGSPTRLIHAESQRQIVVASLCTDVRRSSLSNSRTEEKRQIYPAISFIPSRKDRPSYTYEMEPGETVHALAEWRYREPREGKEYAFIIVAGSCVRRDGISRRGKITFLQPKNDKWEVIGISKAKTRGFEEPVWALAMYDESTFVASVGHELHMLRYNSFTGDWDPICQPLRLAGRAIRITLDERKRLYVSTAKDGVSILIVAPDTAGRAVFQYCALSPYAAISLNHINIRLETLDRSIAMLSTREGELHGLIPQLPWTIDRSSLKPIFRAELPHSLLRLRQAQTRPPWSAPLPTPFPPVIAATTPGSLQVILPIPETLWRRLFWLQRLIEWDLASLPVKYFAVLDDGRVGETTRSLPIGLSSSSTDIVPLSMSNRIKKEGDMHIDGDILARLFDGPQSANEKLKGMLMEYRDAKGDPIRDWMSAHLEDEMSVVDEVVKDVRALCFGWL